MQYDIAQSILQSTMKHWGTQKMAEETRDIQIISEIKYDDYQQYTHGMRYIESLALWLLQFGCADDRDLAYNLIKDNLIYISQEEMRQLITYAYPMKMKKYLMNMTRQFCDNNNIISLEDRKEIYKFYRRCSLFLGLSDGAHMDFFRRQNKELSNEQVFLHYNYSDDKAKEMKHELENDAFIQSVAEKYEGKLNPQFYSYFLIDDFTGSGKSYIRYEGNEWKGKIKRFFEHVDRTNIEHHGFEVHIIIYIATPKALNSIIEQVNTFGIERGLASITVDALQMVEPIIWDNNLPLYNLLKDNYEMHSKHFCTTYVDDHFKVGEGKDPFLGFADCSLSLVLDHNTPNNTLPVIWYSWDDTVNALFPRITRHKEL